MKNTPAEIASCEIMHHNKYHQAMRKVLQAFTRMVEMPNRKGWKIPITEAEMLNSKNNHRGSCSPPLLKPTMVLL
jgi:hypothetical protein